jgi:hypothetical protein
MILKIFSPKNSVTKLAFLTQNKAKLCKILIITLVFGKNVNFLDKNCRKSQKNVFMTPGANPTIVIYNASVVNFYNATGSLARFENKNILFYFVKRSSLLQRWRCSSKLKNRRIGSRSQVSVVVG